MRICLGTLVLTLCGCSKSTYEGPVPTCEAFDGSWQISADFGNGLIAAQQWVFSRSSPAAPCQYHLSAVPADPNGLLPAEIDGNASGDGLWMHWSAPTVLGGACHFDNQLDLALSAAASGLPAQLNGTLSWFRTATGQGYCASALGQIVIRGVR